MTSANVTKSFLDIAEQLLNDKNHDVYYLGRAYNEDEYNSLCKELSNKYPMILYSGAYICKKTNLCIYGIQNAYGILYVNLTDIKNREYVFGLKVTKIFEFLSGIRDNTMNFVRLLKEYSTALNAVATINDACNFAKTELEKYIKGLTIEEKLLFMI